MQTEKHPRINLVVMMVLLAVIMSCSNREKPLFELIAPAETGITFNNRIQDSDSFNIITEEYLYNGGGVAIGDFNNDGLQDIFFTGNQVSNKLYLNRGEMKFDDISEESGVVRTNTWSSGAVVVDINGDGWDDLYVTATMNKDSLLRKNMLFVNQGLTNGRPTFVDKADAYGIADTGYSTMAAFFDYDLDGDLDLYVLTNQHLKSSPAAYRQRINDGSAVNNDRLYRNNGDGTFSNVTKEAGILYEGFGLGLAVSDLNLDGWPDLYISNDFLSNDLLYLNKRNGTFENVIRQVVGHQSYSSMGNDAADLNNDGRPDIVTLDMLPETNSRQKTTINNKSYANYINNERYAYEYQYVRNMLHINNGFENGIQFSEIGQLSGIHQTEWSWAPLFADYDNDGWKDLVITNGFPRDITDKDFSNYREDAGRYLNIANLLDSIPQVKVPNYVYRGGKDLRFSDVSQEWGFTHPSYSNGAAYADLDNDGDLDFIINNIDGEAFIYDNTARQTDPVSNFLRLKLKGTKENPGALGAKILVYAGGGFQYFENYVARGYLSSVEPYTHVGLGDTRNIDSVVVLWPDRSKTSLAAVGVNQVLTLTQDEATVRGISVDLPFYIDRPASFPIRKVSIPFKHREDDRIDFNIQRTLPHKLSQSGPGLAVGDVNGDGLEDFIAGGSVGYPASVFIQQADGSFSVSHIQSASPKKEEDAGMLLFDSDNDGDLDLYVVSGSIEDEPNASSYQDRLYHNDGMGNFHLATDVLPKETTSGSCVRGADFDGDGDIDLFIGGRVIPGGYPYSPRSFLFQNENGKFVDVTASYALGLDSIGMVTDALFTDFNTDGRVDLIVVGEFMPVTFFENTGNSFRKLKDTGADKFTGWWNSITGGDFDNDGDIDYVVGNLGENNNYQAGHEHPLHVIAKDIDNNGSVDAVLGCYLKTSLTDSRKELYPIHFWDELNSQSPKFRKKFSSFRQYGHAKLIDLFSPDDLKDALHLEANHFSSSYIENLGNGRFKLSILPIAVQVAPVNGMITDDFDNDGNLDILMVGNDFGNEVFWGRYDAFTGLVLKGDGTGNFDIISSVKSGFYVPGDAKSLIRLTNNGDEYYITSVNRDSIRAFVREAPDSRVVITTAPTDAALELVYTDGRKVRSELYYGAGYMSQSSRRKASVNSNGSLKEVRIYSFSGEMRTIPIASLRYDALSKVK